MIREVKPRTRERKRPRQKAKLKRTRILVNSPKRTLRKVARNFECKKAAKIISRIC